MSDMGFGGFLDPKLTILNFFLNFSLTFPIEKWIKFTVLFFSVTYFTGNRVIGKSVRNWPPTFFILVR